MGEMKEVLITTVVPTYNRATLVVDALDSVYAQAYRPIEVIVVDDGSTDDTEEVIENWIQEHAPSNEFSVRYIYQKNAGGNVARNHGIREASGAWVAFLDSDDRWDTAKLEKQMRVAAEDSGIGAVYCGLRHWYADKNQFGTIKRDYPQGNLLNQLLVHDVTAPTSCYLVRKELLEQCGLFDESLQARQDWDMWIRLATVTQVGAVPEALVDYREHSGVRTISNPQKELTAYARIMEKYIELRGCAPMWVRHAAWGAYYRRRARVYFHQSLSRRLAFYYALKALSLWPFAFDGYAVVFGMFMPAGLRCKIRCFWNRAFGKTFLTIRSH